MQRIRRVNVDLAFKPGDVVWWDGYDWMVERVYDTPGRRVYLDLMRQGIFPAGQIREQVYADVCQFVRGARIITAAMLDVRRSRQRNRR